ncbi:preprotein translocase subunit YajC [Streptococcus suis]|uniref:preprotein translocase subunit YajC n=1 Tax=Streptococcus suis TaxID=1307 RepID=UPI000CF520B6|nr:preprotein translocase subunit YajC [Streptococcus suis]NQJ66150.1 preprotein translocase subunit YajC [Streptococcus suis]HEL2459801.1 preprotein translocase subunit YajC [Streptococcus suis]HEM2771173.1 preprotein translocase subunit YajC [Streptococcus suis]HEM6071634.1 preprotein translocase subunit YajC [Streptococcus suis]HEM6177191.1 preprotein translocase subunit YajC [Streptococcus suis]
MDQQTLYYALIILVALSTILPVLTSYVNRKRQQKALEEQLENRQRYLSTLQAGDEVILFSGLHGKIIKLTDSLVELQIAKGIIVYVEKESIMGKAKELLFTK